MVGRGIEAILSTWNCMIGGAALLAACGFAGWRLSLQPDAPIVRFTERWVVRVVEPLVKARRWRIRAFGIFVNNAATLSLLVLCGLWPATAALGVMGCGLFLGIALRLLSDRSDWARRAEDTPVAVDWRMVVGLSLNLLEPPAILAAIGLTLGQSLVSMDSGEAWRAFAVVVAPLLLAAACGEALWIGALHDSAPKGTSRR